MYHLEIFMCYKNIINLSLSKFQNHVNLSSMNFAFVLLFYLLVIVHVVIWASALGSRNNRYITVGDKYRLFKSYLLMCRVALLFPAPAWPQAGQHCPSSLAQENAPPVTKHLVVCPLQESGHQGHTERISQMVLSSLSTEN